MGGRGSGSGLGGGSASKTPQSIGACRDLQELAQYMSNEHYIHVETSSLARQDFGLVKDSASAIERVIREFPQAAANFHALRGEDLGRSTLAQASYSGVITTANDYYYARGVLESAYERGVRNGFHPAGTNYSHVATHEAGHVLERALIDKYVLSNGNGVLTQMEAHKAWNKCTYASKVITEACKAAKKMPDGKGLKNTDLIRRVSGYATKNRSEALAECVADYVANGSRAQPLSRAVWAELKKELG